MKKKERKTILTIYLKLEKEEDYLKSLKKVYK